jgi:hypothetical protein
MATSKAMDAFKQIARFEKRREKALLRHRDHRVKPSKKCYFCRVEKLERERWRRNG